MDAKTILARFDEQQGFMEETVKANIERYRKGNLCLTVTNRDGSPLAGVKLKIAQKSHNFRFGANLFLLDELESPEKNTRYREQFPQLFNLAVLPMYWRDLEPEQGVTRYTKNSPRRYRRPNPELCLEFCREHGIEPKAHCLMYDNESPAWLPGNIDDIKNLYRKRFAELSALFAKDIPGWEVTNETLSVRQPNHTVFHEAPGAVEWSLNLARKYFPENHLIVNEAPNVIWPAFVGDRSWYYLQIAGLLAGGASIDAIGMQYHLFAGEKELTANAGTYLNPQHIYRVLDLYARLGKPLQITEVTVPACHGDASGEKQQADIVKQLYTIWFSHPAIEAIIYWNSVDGYAYGALPGDMTAGENIHFGGLTRFNLSEKPARTVLDELINHEWRTSLSIETDAAGQARFRGFGGNYEVQTDAGGRSEFAIIPGEDRAAAFTVF